MSLAVANCILWKRIKSLQSHKGLSWVWHKTLSYGEVPILELFVVITPRSTEKFLPAEFNRNLTFARLFIMFVSTKNYNLYSLQNVLKHIIHSI